jgi:hypothetical protein
VVRNKLAHDTRQPSSDYTYRALDTGGRLIAAASPSDAVEILRMRDELMEERGPLRNATAPTDRVTGSMPHETSTREPRVVEVPISPEADPIVAEALRLMDTIAQDLDLRIKQTRGARTYRRGKAGPSVWIDLSQGRFVVDLRTLALRQPEANAGGLVTSIARLSSLPIQSDQPGIPITRDLLERWAQLRSEVLEPFFHAYKGSP